MDDSGAKGVVVLVDDHCLRRQAMVGLLEDWARALGLEILQVEKAESLQSAARDLDLCRLGIINFGSQGLNHMDSQVTLRLISALIPDRPIVVLSDSDAPGEIRLAQKSDVRGYIPTNMEPRIAIAALNLLLSGGEYFPSLRCAGPESEESESQGAASKDGEKEPSGAHPALTTRQDAVLNALRQGKSNKQIARELDVSEATVKIHMRQLLRKLGAANRTQAAIIALSRQVIEPHVDDSHEMT